MTSSKQASGPGLVWRALSFDRQHCIGGIGADSLSTQAIIIIVYPYSLVTRVQELCESRGGRPGLPVLIRFMVSVDVK